MKNLSALTLLLLSILAHGAGGLDRSVSRGVETKTFDSPSGPEICVIPKHLAGTKYRGKDGARDLESEQELCSYNLNKAGPTSQDGGVAACPKVNSTSTAIEFQEIVKAGTKADLETAAKCGFTRETSTVTKFKTSDNDRTCTYAPGATLAYHLSRYLGDVLHVPVAVLRTVDISTMQRVAATALKMRINGNLRKGYQNYVDAYRDPTRWDYASWIFTSDYKQHYGFLRDKVRGDTSMPGWTENIAGPPFETMQATRDAFSPSSSRDLFGTALSQVGLQRLQLARDTADLIVLDQLMSQSDRYTGMNMAAIDLYYYRDGERALSSIEKGKVDKGEKPKPAGAMLVKRMVAKDNDCTFVNGNTNAKLGYAAALRHIHPVTYAGVQRLAKGWTADSSVKNFLSVEMGMTAKHLTTFGNNLTSVAHALRTNCESGALKLDLDPELHFLGAEAKKGCDLL